MKNSNSLPNLARRTVLRQMITGAALSAFPVPAFATPNPVKKFSLTAQLAEVPIFGGKWPDTPVWCYSGQTPGPILRAKQGDRLQIEVENKLLEPTTIHWHGLRIPIEMDGVPGISQPPILPGERFTYEFDLPDAGTFWYHPHVNSSEQVARGLNGVLIVDEATPPPVDRDEVWVLDDWRMNRDATLVEDFGRGMDVSHGGRHGNLITLNGKIPGPVPVRSGERLRLRLVNVANARIFSITFTGHAPKIIAIDGHGVEPHAPQNGEVVLGPGQRVDVILDCIGVPGKKFSIVEAAQSDQPFAMFDLQYGDQKALADPQGRFGPVTSPAPNPLSEPDLSKANTHQVIMEGGAMGGMQSATFNGEKMAMNDLVKEGRIWALNGVAAHQMAMPPMFTLKRGTSHIIQVRNDTVFDHPMHLHGHAFRILSRNGQSIPHQPWADTVLVAPRSTVEIAFVADNVGDWLFHCHVLEHVVGGMTSVFRVV